MTRMTLHAGLAAVLAGVLLPSHPHAQSQFVWTNVTPATLPPLGNSGMAYDPSHAKTVLFVGYPGDKPIGTMWQETCEALPENTDESVLRHQCYAYPGSNGGPLFTRDADKAAVVALQVASSTDAAVALLLTPPRVAWINQLSR